MYCAAKPNPVYQIIRSAQHASSRCPFGTSVSRVDVRLVWSRPCVLRPHMGMQHWKVQHCWVGWLPMHNMGRGWCMVWLLAQCHSATVPEHWSQAHPALLLGASGLREQRQGGSSVNSSGIILNPCVCGTDAASVAARLQLCSHMGVTQLGRSARQGVSRKTGGCQQCRWRHNCDLPAQPSAECLAGLLPL
jgi:hypothetical protein